MTDQTKDVPLDEQTGRRQAIKHASSVEASDTEDGHVLRWHWHHVPSEREEAFPSAIVQVGAAKGTRRRPRAFGLAEHRTFLASRAGRALSKGPAELRARRFGLAKGLQLELVEALNKGRVLRDTRPAGHSGNFLRFPFVKAKCCLPGKVRNLSWE